MDFVISATIEAKGAEKGKEVIVESTDEITSHANAATAAVERLSKALSAIPEKEEKARRYSNAALNPYQENLDKLNQANKPRTSAASPDLPSPSTVVQSSTTAASVEQDYVRIVSAVEAAYSKILQIEQVSATARAEVEKNFANLSVAEQQRLTAETINEINRRSKEEATAAKAAIKEAEAAANKKPKGDPDMDKALADIRRYQQSRAKMEQDYTSLVSSQAESQYQARTKQWQRGLDEFQKVLNQAARDEEKTGTNSIKNSAIGSFIGNLAANGVSRFTSLIEEGGAAVLDYSAKLEQARIGFVTLTGSTEAADAHIRDLQNFAKTTPFEFAGLVEASQKMQGVGIDSKRVIPILKDVGNALAAAGKGNAEIDRTVLALTQIQAKGKLAAQEVNQLAENGIPAWQILSKELNKSTAEVLKLSENGQISSKIFLEALHRYSEEKFGDAMEKQSRTFSGAMSNIKDALMITASTAFKPLFDKISEVAIHTSDQLGKSSDFNQTLNTLGTNMAKAIGAGLAAQLKAEWNNIETGKSQVFTPWGFGGDFGEGLKDGNDGKSLLETSWLNASPVTSAKKSPAQLSNDAAMHNAAQANQDRKFLNQFQKPTAAADPLTIARTQKQNLKDLDEQQKQQTAALQSSYRIQEAQLNSHLTFTTAQELDQYKAISQAKQTFYSNQIGLENSFYGRQLAAAKGDADKTAEITAKHNETISKLSGDSQVEQINSQKQIAQYERQIFEQRRQAALQFYEINQNAAKAASDKQIFDVTRAIDQETVSASEGYDRLKTITFESYDETTKHIQTAYQLQLANQSLTSEQRINLQKQENLDLQNLAEENRRKQIEIEDQRVQKMGEILQRQSKQYADFYNVLYAGQEVFEGFFNSQSFNSADFDRIQKDYVSPNVETLAELTKKRSVAATNYEKTQKAITANDNGTTPLDPDVLQNLRIAVSGATEQIKGLDIQIGNLNLQVDSTKRFTEYGNALKKGFDFDAVGLDLLLDKQSKERDNLQNQISLNQQLRGIETNKSKQITLGNELTLLLGQQAALEVIQKLEEARYNAGTTKGLTDRLNRLKNGDVGEVTAVRDSATKQILQDQASLYENSILLQEKLAHVGEDSAVRYKTAWLNAMYAVKDADIQAVESQIASQIRIADNATLHVEQIRASVLNHLSEVKSLSAGIADGINGVYDAIGSKIDNLIDRNTKKLGFLSSLIAEPAKALIKGELSSITSGILDSIFPGQNHAAPTGNIVADKINDSNRHLARIDNALTGGGSSTSSAVGGVVSAATGSPSGGGLNLGSLISGLIGGAGKFFGIGNSSRVNPSFSLPAAPAVANSSASSAAAISPQAVSQQVEKVVDTVSTAANKTEIQAPASITDAPGGGSGNAAVSAVNASGILGGKFSLSSLTKGLGSLAPALGLGLGGSLGGGSGLSGILGSIGGLGAGMLGSALISGTAGSLFGGLFAGGFAGAGTYGAGALTIGTLGAAASATLVLAPIAAALIVGGILLNRNKQRKADEVTRTATINDALSQIDKLTKDVSSDRVEGQSALASSSSIRQQYLDSVGQLKDKKTRNIALADVSRIDSRIIYLQQAVSSQEGRQDTASKFKGEFATGGIIYADGGAVHPAFANALGYKEVLPRGFQGLIPGSFDHADDIRMNVSRGEHVMILNPTQYATIGDRLRPLLDEAQVPQHEGGAVYTPSAPVIRSSGNSSSDDGSGEQKVQLVIENFEVKVEGGVDAEGIWIKGFTNRAFNAIVKRLREFHKNKGRTSS